MLVLRNRRDKGAVCTGMVFRPPQPARMCSVSTASSAKGTARFMVAVLIGCNNFFAAGARRQGLEGLLSNRIGYETNRAIGEREVAAIGM